MMVSRILSLHFSEKHLVLSPFTSVKKSKTTQLCPHRVPIFLKDEEKPLSLSVTVT